MLSREASVTLYVWGHRGLGKSSIVAQTMAENGMGIVDLRLSQLESSDLRGLPDRDLKNNRTIYLPPADMPTGDTDFKDFLAKYENLKDEEKDEYWVKMQPKLKEGTLFLDEVNRGQDDVLQAVFQLVLDRRIGQYVMPMGWHTVCAGNFMEGYQTNGFTDPAFLNRFCHVVFSGGDTTLEEWVHYIAEKHGQNASQVIEYATQNIKHLDGEIEGEMGFTIQPSRRSWEAVIRVMTACGKAEAEGKEFSQEAKIEIIAGLVGRELALAFTRYNCPVKPKDLLTAGVKSLQLKLEKLNRNQMVGLVWGFVGFAKPKIEEDKTAGVVCDFAEWMCKHYSDKDIVVAMCKSLVSGSGDSEEDSVRSACLTNPKLAKLLSKGNNSIRKSLIDRLNARPDLQQLLASTSWGKD